MTCLVSLWVLDKREKLIRQNIGEIDHLILFVCICNIKTIFRQFCSIFGIMMKIMTYMLLRMCKLEILMLSDWRVEVNVWGVVICQEQWPLFWCLWPLNLELWPLTPTVNLISYSLYATFTLLHSIMCSYRLQRL